MLQLDEWKCKWAEVLSQQPTLKPFPPEDLIGISLDICLPDVIHTLFCQPELSYYHRRVKIVLCLPFDNSIECLKALLAHAKLVH